MEAAHEGQQTVGVRGLSVWPVIKTTCRLLKAALTPGVSSPCGAVCQEETGPWREG